MQGRIFGYARVSSKEQNLDRQIEKLREYVSEENLLQEKQSGKDFDRPVYQALKGALGLRAGDTLVITSLDRLSRNKSDIKNELQWFKEHGVRLMILDLPTTLVQVEEQLRWIIDMITNILVEVLASMAEQERIVIKQRQREGIEAAKKKGKHLGRPRIQRPDNFGEVYQCWRAEKITAKEAMRLLKMSSSSFYRMVQQFESESKT